MLYCSEAGVKANYGLAGDVGSSHDDGDEDAQVVLDSFEFFGFFDFYLFFDFYDFYFPEFLGFSYNNRLYLRSRMAGGVTNSR